MSGPLLCNSAKHVERESDNEGKQTKVGLFIYGEGF